MSTVTANTLIDEVCSALGMTWVNAASAASGDVTDVKSRPLVSFINKAIRWIYRGDDPLWIWPQTVTSSDSVTVTDDTIAWADVGSSDAVAFFESDPTIIPTGSYESPVPPVPVSFDGTQFRILKSGVASPVFAYWRTSVPSITWASSGSSPAYSTPTVPADFLDPIVEYTLYQYFRSVSSSGAERMGDARQRAQEWVESRKLALRNSPALIPWDNNVTAATI